MGERPVEEVEAMEVEFRTMGTGLFFPEGPVACADGSVIVVELFGQCLTRIRPDGSKEKVADVPGGPNGAAFGPDGALYVCNNGGCFTPSELGGLTFPGPYDPDRYIGGRIQRVDLATGEVTDLYTECDGHPLRAPNDLVIDAEGGIWFTDHGIRDHHARTSDLTGIYYARCDGSAITEMAFPCEAPNGIGLSPDGLTVYWAETYTGRAHQRRLSAPGVLDTSSDLFPVLAGLPGLQLFDSLAVDGEGNVAIATLVTGAITSFAPDGTVVDQIPTGDRMTTNICFGGPDLRTAYVTCSGTGTLLAAEWPRPGLALAHAG